MASDVKCPVCGSRTRLGTRRSDGSKFYVCINWPDCRGKVAYGDEWDFGEDDWDDKPVSRATQQRAPQRTERPRSGSRAELNWFQRHLNWTWFVSPLIVSFLAGLITGFIDPNMEGNVAYGLGCLIGLFVALVVGGWVLWEKGRSAAWLLVLFLPFGWIIFLMLENRKQGQRKSALYRWMF